MSRPYFIPQATFRADLHADELIHERISACDRAFELGDLDIIKYAIISFENWILGEDMADQPCLLELQKIEKAWDKTYAEKLAVYQKEVEKSLCPDVIPKPKNMPNLDYWRMKYIAMWSLCQRKRLLFKASKKVSY